MSIFSKLNYIQMKSLILNFKLRVPFIILCRLINMINTHTMLGEFTGLKGWSGVSLNRPILRHASKGVIVKSLK